MCHLGIAGGGTKAAQEIDVENTGALSVPTTEGANSGGGAGEENVSVFNADNKTFFCFLILSTNLDSLRFYYMQPKYLVIAVFGVVSFVFCR